MIRTLTCIALASAVAFGAQSVSAAPINSDETVISARGLDLSRSADQRALKARIEKAARSVCVGQGVRDLQTHAAEDACVSEAFDEALREFNLAPQGKQTSEADRLAESVALDGAATSH